VIANGGQRVEGQRAVPVADRGVELVAAAADRTPGRLGDDARFAGLVHGLAVGAQPVAHGLEAGDGLGRDPAVAVGAHVEQVVAAAAGDVGEVGVPLGVAPGAVERHAALPQLAGDRLARDLLLRGTGVAVDDAALADPVVDHDAGAEVADVGLEALAVTVGPRVVGPVGAPLAVEPEDRRVVVVDEFLELGVHALLVARERGRVGEVGVVPVPDGVVEAELDAALRGGLLELVEDVAVLVEARVVAQVPVVDLGRPHRVALVVFGGDHDVALAGVLRGLGDGVGVGVLRVEGGGLSFVLVFRDLAFALDPLGVAADGAVGPVYSPSRLE
jgi:hypothetical protein